MRAVLMRITAGATGPAINRLELPPKSSTVCLDALAEESALQSSSTMAG
jgi:hypothetical protein